MEMTSYNDVDAGDMFAAADYYSAGDGGDLFDMVWPGRRRRRQEDNTSGCLPLSPPPPPPELAVDDQLLAGGDGGGSEPVAVAVAEDDDSGERWTENQKRRCKINENLKTLQQLVPGCDKSNNQASTLDKTIRYMKSLQQHVQAMSVGCIMKPAAAGVSYQPFPQPPPPEAVTCWSSWRRSPQDPGMPLLDLPPPPLPLSTTTTMTCSLTSSFCWCR
uniref:BHLH domain-containing protein n=1 Tax=Oryza nivara TaxID=4536 RepID=A0A0E0JC11_ORYNI